MKKKVKAVSAACAVSVVLALSGCNSVPKEIPADMPLEELKQNAYECTAYENYKGAEKYYSTIIERYGTNLSVLVAAEYEIGHLYIKQKKFNRAKPYLERVLNYYEFNSNGLNPQFQKLAVLDMEKIKAAQESKVKKSKRTSKSKAPKE